LFRSWPPSGGSAAAEWANEAASVGALNIDRLLFGYLLRLGDSPLILAQRLGAWVGKGPILEEDMALANVGLDLLGQARMWLTYAGEVESRFAGKGRSEDQLGVPRGGGR